MIEEAVITIDVESHTIGGRPNPDKDILKYIGIRLPNGIKHIFSHPAQKLACQNMMNRYRYIVNHNWKGFDLPMLQRHGYRFNNKVHIDTYEIIKKRAKSMMYIDFGMGQMSLKYLCNFFGMKTQKGEFDYNLLKKPMLKPDEYRELREYLFKDLDSTFELFEYLYNFFMGFKDLVSDKNRLNFNWLTASAGSVVYKILCHQSGLPEIYNDAVGEKYQGSFVSQPTLDYVEGDIYCFDFASLYPHMFMGGNLYSPDINSKVSNKPPESTSDVWVGNTMFPVKGSYKRDMGVIEKTIQFLYKSRVADKIKMKSLSKDDPEYIMLDRRQLAKKIAINTAYGISGSATFASVYNRTTASDCTLMARSAILHARELLEKHGYECVYTDTDSVYVKDPYGDLQRLKNLAKAITNQQIANFNIPIDTHNFEYEDSIKRMYFFRNDAGQFTKKHYIYITDSDKVTIKGLKPVRGDCSKVAKLIYSTIIEQELKNGRDNQYYTINYIQKQILELAGKHPDVLKKRYRVYDPDSYKSQTSIQCQIARKYGEGEHYLIPNKFIGVGKGSKYATLEELHSVFGSKWLDSVSIDRYIRDLSEFIKPGERKQIGKRSFKDSKLSDYS